MIYEKIRDLPERPLVMYTDHGEIPAHHHASLEVAYILEGDAMLSIDDETYTLKEHQFAVIGSHAVHSYLRHSGVCIVVLLPMSCVKAYRDRLAGCVFSPCVMNDTETLFVKNLFETIRRAENADDVFSAFSDTDDFIWQATQTFLEYCFVQSGTVKKTNRSLPEEVHINEYLEQNYTENISVADLAKQFGYSEKHMTEIMECLFGMPLKEYIRMLRISEAKRMLLEGKTIDETASLLGFSCTRTFLRAFEKITGRTPGAFKRARANESAGEAEPNDELLFH